MSCGSFSHKLLRDLELVILVIGQVFSLWIVGALAVLTIPLLLWKSVSDAIPFKARSNDSTVGLTVRWAGHPGRGI